MGIRIFAVVGSLLILATMAIAIAIYFKVIPVPMSLLGTFIPNRQPEFSARYYPPDTAAYAWMTLAPAGRQMEYMNEIWELLHESEVFVRALDGWKEGLDDETGIHFDEDVATWIGPELSVGLMDTDEETDAPVAAALIGIRDRDRAANFMELWTSYAADEWETTFHAGTFQGNPTWISVDVDQAYSLTDGWLVFATNEATLEEMIARVEGGGEGSLAETMTFQEARMALAEDRFASLYLDTERAAGIAEQLEGEWAPVVPGVSFLVSHPTQATEWVGVTATWVERGLVVSSVSPSGPAEKTVVADLEAPARLVPHDTLALVAASFDPDLDHWRMALADQPLSALTPGDGTGESAGSLPPEPAAGGEPVPEHEQTLAELLDDALALVNEATGIDLEADFFDHLAGTAILAVRDFDLEAVRSDPIANPVDAVAMLAYKRDRRDQLDATMGHLANLARSEAGLTAESVDVGGESPATVFDLAPLEPLIGGPTEYRPGYVLHDRYLTLGTTDRALIAAVALQNGQGQSLSSDAEYQRAAQFLPAAQQVTGYLNARRILSQLGDPDPDDEAGLLEALRDATGVVAFGSSIDEDYSRGVAVITLFPE